MKIELKCERAQSGKLRKENDLLRTGLEKEQQKHEKTVRELQELMESLQSELCTVKDEDNKHVIKSIIQDLENIISSQEEIVIPDPNGLGFDGTLASFQDQAISPGEPIHFEFEGKIAVDEFTLQAILATNRDDSIGGWGGGGGGDVR